MPSKLGTRIRGARKKKNIGLRELARRIKKSPALLTRLESDEAPPSVTPDTLKSIAVELGIEPDVLLLLANRTGELAPTTKLEVALYRKVKDLPKQDQERLLKALEESGD